jgi:hypothetical protein
MIGGWIKAGRAVEISHGKVNAEDITQSGCPHPTAARIH